MKIIFMIIISFSVLFIYGNIFLRWCKWYRKLSCRCGWHSYPDFSNIHYKTDDPLIFLVFAKCKWCGYEGQIDSQGNLF
jgi:hypothetical protein